jgi:hypothetical protein
VRTRPVTLVLGLAALGGLTACAASVGPETLQAWVGKPATALTQDWGPATREVKEGEGRILIYEQIDRSTPIDFRTVRPTTRNTYGRAQEAEQLPQAPIVHVRSYLFWVDRDGVIVQTAVRAP